jgi:tryptophan 2,3-dioxygenase
VLPGSRVNYWDYIQVEKLLSLQHGLHDDGSEPANDEVLFITVHQIYELWFKLVLRELSSARALFRLNPVPDQALADVVRSLRRCTTIFHVAADHWRVVETLTTRDYLAFRDKLVGASGFQSAQIRELELLLGLEDRQRLSCAGESSYKDALRGDIGDASPALKRVERRIAEGPSYRDALYDWLARTPIDGSSDPADVDAYLNRFIDAHRKQKELLLERARGFAGSPEEVKLLEERYARDIEQAVCFLRADDIEDTSNAAGESERARRKHVRAALVFIESHRELPRLSWPREVVDSTLNLEQAFIIWRQRHARMVERMIGRRTGTGGSGGVAYLDRTALEYRVFEDLWSVRTILLRRELVPDLKNAADYRFRIED